MESLRRDGATKEDAFEDHGSPGGSPGKVTLTEALRPHEASDHTDGAIGSDGRPTNIATLLRRVDNHPTGLHYELLSHPGLRTQIEAYFATGGDAALNDLLARAFPKRTADVASSTSGGVEREKEPKDAMLPLPAARADTKTLAKGEMHWTLRPLSHSQARADVDFLPDKAKVDAKNVSFVQTVLNALADQPMYAGASTADPVGNKSLYAPYEDGASKRRVDHVAGSENDPLYGAEWDPVAKKWKSEGGGTVVGNSKKGVSATAAKMNDNPITGLGRAGKGDTTKEFETVAVALETREALGALKWGYRIRDQENAPIELTGATKADCTDAPSASWGAALDKFYEAKFEILDSFVQDKADLTPAHTGILDGIAAKMKTKPVLQAELGGAADLKDKEPAKVSEARADAAKAYLVSKGIDAGRITVQAYAADWARAATTAGASEPKNRRVQIWVK